MRELSAASLALVCELHRASTPRIPFLKNTDKTIRVLRVLGESGELAGIPAIFPFTLDSNDQISSAAGESISKLTDGLEPGDYLDLDLRVRDTPYWQPAYSFHPGDVVGARFFHRWQSNPHVLGIAACNRSGYVREEAVRRLASLGITAGLSYLLIRLNDWVPSVRVQALLAARNRLTSDNRTGFLKCLPIVLRLPIAGRIDLRPFVRDVFDLLNSQDFESELTDGLAQLTGRIRREYYKLALDMRVGIRESQVPKMMEDLDPFIRKCLVSWVLSDARSATAKQVLSILLSDKVESVRKDALYAVAEKYPELKEKALMAGLFDTSESVREVSRYFLQKHGEIDLRGEYLRAVTGVQGAMLVGAIAGLGECRNLADVEVLEPFLSHPAALVRRETIRSLQLLREGHYLPEFLRALGDTSLKVVRTAAKAIANCSPSAAPEQLWEMIQSSKRTSVRIIVLRLLIRVERWMSVPFLVLAAADQDEAVCNEAVLGLIRLRFDHNRTVFTIPSAEVKARIREALGAFKGELQFELRQWLTNIASA